MTTSVRSFLSSEFLIFGLAAGHIFHGFLTCCFSGYIRLVWYKDIRNGYIILKTRYSYVINNDYHCLSVNEWRRVAHRLQLVIPSRRIPNTLCTFQDLRHSGKRIHSLRACLHVFYQYLTLLSEKTKKPSPPKSSQNYTKVTAYVC